jgi:voltage-gated potassium channel
VSSTSLWWAEGTVQPKDFGSIPRALRWSIITLTTIGYGDTFPVTALGRVFAGLTAIAGVGLVAMPTGILADGLPTGVQIIGPYLEDRTPLRFAQLIERELGGYRIPTPYA